MDILKEVVLIDYNAIFKENGWINNGVKNFINYTIAVIGYDLIVFTARILTSKEIKKYQTKLDKHLDLPFLDFLYVRNLVNNSEIDTKLALYHNIKDKFDVKMIIERDKKVIKAFQKSTPILGLRPYEPLEEDEI